LKSYRPNSLLGGFYSYSVGSDGLPPPYPLGAKYLCWNWYNCRPFIYRFWWFIL